MRRLTGLPGPLLALARITQSQCVCLAPDHLPAQWLCLAAGSPCVGQAQLDSAWHREERQ